MINITSLIQLAIPFTPTPSITDGLNLYLYGIDSLTNSLNLITQGSIELISDLNLYTLGSETSTLGINLSLSGALPDLSSELFFFAQADTTTPESSLDFYAYTSDIGSDEEGINLFAKVPEGSTMDFVLFGPGNTFDDNLNLYARGANVIDSGLNMITGHSADENDSSVTFYAVGF